MTNVKNVMSNVKYQMSNVNKVKLLSELTSGIPPVIFDQKDTSLLGADGELSSEILTLSFCLNFKH